MHSQSMTWHGSMQSARPATGVDSLPQSGTYWKDEGKLQTHAAESIKDETPDRRLHQDGDVDCQIGWVPDSSEPSGCKLAPPEVSRGEWRGAQLDAPDARWAEPIFNEMHTNLRAQNWLGEFVPMRVTCPIMGRKISPEAIPLFAEAAWDCNGLGFAWECIAGNKAMQ